MHTTLTPKPSAKYPHPVAMHEVWFIIGVSLPVANALQTLQNMISLYKKV